MVQNKLHWDANDAVGLSKQRNSYQASPTFLCFESPTASFASQCNLFRTMWPNPAKGLFINSRCITVAVSFIIYTDCWTSSFANYQENEAWVKIEAIMLISINIAFVNRTTVVYLRSVILLGTNIIRCLSRTEILLLDKDSFFHRSVSIP